jgi:uncharacterized protein (TIGR02271 family)
MATRQNTSPSDTQLSPLSRLDGYEVADNDPDVRGWNVTTTDGTGIGRVEDLLVDVGQLTTRYLVVRLDRGSAVDESGEDVLVPVERAHLERSAREVRVDVTPAAMTALPRFTGVVDEREFSRGWAPDPSASERDDTRVMTRSAEELRIGKRTVAAGEVQVSKHVETEHVTQPVTRSHEEVSVERRPVAEREASPAALRDDEIRIPVSEEEIVVEKRPVVKEEIVIKKHTVQEKTDVAADLRKERVDVERIDDPQRRPRSSKER